jgi:hypothetical protein
VEVLSKEADTLTVWIKERVEHGSAFQVTVALGFDLPQASVIDLAVIDVLGQVGDKEYLSPFQAGFGKTWGKAELKTAELARGGVGRLQNGPLRDCFNMRVEMGLSVFDELARFRSFLIYDQQLADVCCFCC